MKFRLLPLLFLPVILASLGTAQAQISARNPKPLPQPRGIVPGSNHRLIQGSLIDVNNDSRADLILGDPMRNATSVFWNQPGGRITDSSARLRAGTGLPLTCRHFRLDNDSLPDLMVPQWETEDNDVYGVGDTLNFYRATPQGPVLAGSASQYHTLCFADADHDGDDDLYFNHDSIIGICPNLGGHFGADSTLYTIPRGTNGAPPYVTWVQPIDLNHDGILEIAYNCYFTNLSGTYAIIGVIKKGSSGYAFQQRIDTEAFLWDFITPSVTDVDGDGDLDIVGSLFNYLGVGINGGRILTLLNNGQGGVDPLPSAFKKASRYYRHYITDLNNDGRTEVTLWMADSLQTFVMNAAQLYTLQASFRIPHTDLGQDYIMDLKDVTGDGNPDIVCGHRDNNLSLNSYYYLPWTGPYQFGAAQPFYSIEKIDHFLPVREAGLPKGILELNPSEVYFQPEGDPGQVAPYRVLGPVNSLLADTLPDRIVYTSLEDLNGDQVKEIVCRTDRGLLVAPLQANAPTQLIPYTRKGVLHEANYPALADANGDGSPDLFQLAHGTAGDTVFLSLGLAGGGFGAPVALGQAFTGFCEITGDWVRDMDGDGKADIVLLQSEGQDYRQIYVAFGLGNGAFQAPSVLSRLGNSDPFDPVDFLDLSRDGRLDAVTAHWDSLYVGIQQPGRVFDFQRVVKSLVDTLTIPYHYISTADLNNDSIPDVILQNEQGPSEDYPEQSLTLGVYKGLGNGLIQEQPDRVLWPYPAYQGLHSAPELFIDLNEDGRTDAIGRSFSGQHVYFFRAYDGLITEAKAAAVAKHMSVYPNPAHSTLHVTLPTGEKVQSATLTDALGRTFPATLSQGNIISLKNLKHGLYTVQVSTASGKRLQDKVVVE